MDDALVPSLCGVTQLKYYNVLILVLMDDALVPWSERDDKKVSVMGLNPCFNG